MLGVLDETGKEAAKQGRNTPVLLIIYSEIAETSYTVAHWTPNDIILPCNPDK